MHRVQDKLSTVLDTNNGLWSWAMRHSAWLLNRFAVVHGATPYELVYNKVYQGRMTEFAEPAFSYTHTSHKGNAKWQRVIVLGKTESQYTYVVFTGKSVMLSRSVRRIATDWKNHLGFYIHFNAPTSLVSRLALVAESSQLAAQLKPYLLQAIRPLAKFSHQLFMMQMEKL